MRTPSDVVDATLRGARLSYVRGYSTQLLSDLRAADYELALQLERAGQLELPFTAANASVMRAQIAVAIEYAKHRMAGLTDEQALAAIRRARALTVDMINVFEKTYSGSAAPIRLDVSSNFARSVQDTMGSLVRTIDTSWERYGSAMVEDFDRVMRTSLARNLTTAQTISKMVQAAPPGLARALRDSEPAYFPEPQAGFMARRYWAERIVRTEKANAFNQSTQDTISDVNSGKNGWKKMKMKRKILAFFDRRTAPDSIAVHGQVRGMKEKFVDGAGREYMRPPARPNDRETLVPWRDTWKDTDETAPEKSASADATT